MKKRFAFLLSLLFLASHTIYAQGGCVDSPEAPTCVLGLIGAASIALVTWRGRSSRKR